MMSTVCTGGQRLTCHTRKLYHSPCCVVCIIVNITSAVWLEYAGTRTQVHFTRTRTRVQFCSLWLRLGLGLRTCDSRPSHARVQAVAAVPCCAVYSDIRYILLFVFMFWKINKCWICGLLYIRDLDSRTRTLTLRWRLGLGLWGDDSDSDSEVMTQTWTWTWQPGLGHSTEHYLYSCYKFNSFQYYISVN